MKGLARKINDKVEQKTAVCHHRPFIMGWVEQLKGYLLISLLFFSIKDFAASKLQGQPGQPGLAQLTNGQPKSSREQQGKSDLNVWGEDDVDSVKVNIAKKNYLALFHTCFSLFQSSCLLMLFVVSPSSIWIAVMSVKSDSPFDYQQTS